MIEEYFFIDYKSSFSFVIMKSKLNQQQEYINIIFKKRMLNFDWNLKE